jgi:hypothetical protein
MGITCKKKIICKTQDEFHEIDKTVTGFAFDIHNDIGNFCNEIIYQEILKQLTKIKIVYMLTIWLFRVPEQSNGQH